MWRARAIACGTVCALLLLSVSGCGSDGDESPITGASGPTGVSESTSTEAADGGESRAKSKPPSAADTVRRYYDLVDAADFAAAWPILPPSVQSQSGGFDQWREGYSTTLSTAPSNLTSDVNGDTVVVMLDLEAVDRDACTGNNVHQGFSGSWTLSRAGDNWKAQSIDMRKTSGGTPTLSASECEAQPTTTTTQAPPPTEDCTPGYSPCLAPASDYDCDGGTGDGPAYTGTVQVTGSDPYGLDADGNGVGCE